MIDTIVNLRWKNIFQLPKKYVLNLKDDALSLKFNRLSMAVFIKKYPFLTFKIFYSFVTTSVTEVACQCGKEMYHFFDRMFIDQKIYKDFFLIL